MICPNCGKEALRYEQDALVVLGVHDGVIATHYTSLDVAFLDSGTLVCMECHNDSDDNVELLALLEQIFKAEEDKLDADTE
jgi:hypothetical protein